MNSLLRSRDLQAVEVGYVSDGNSERILRDDNAVDQLATEVTETMLLSGFETSSAFVSFGIQPWTGHTQNLYFQLADNDRVRCIVEISKKAFSAQFEEIEVAVQSDEFSTSDAELSVVRRAAVALNDIIASKFPSRSVRISVFSKPIAESTTIN